MIPFGLGRFAASGKVSGGIFADSSISKGSHQYFNVTEKT